MALDQPVLPFSDAMALQTRKGFVGPEPGCWYRRKANEVGRSGLLVSPQPWKVRVGE